MILGTVVKIQTTISVSGGGSPDTVKVTIYNQNNIVLIDGVDMAADGSGVYSYLFQSSTSGLFGIYKVLIVATSGSYTARSKKTFQLDSL